MSEQNTPQRKVAIPDHVWDSFGQMAADMGSDKDSLISQALFMFARLNGYLAPGVVSAANGQSAAAPHTAAQSAPTVTPRAEPPPPAVAPRRADPDSSLRRPSVPRSTEPPPDDPVRREVASRVLETAAELERLMKDKNQAEPTALPEAATGHELFLMAEDGSLDKVVKERFVIGRGKHCDLVINSGKVSREHAAILREGEEHFIEDLGSSNGTWFNKQRIRRRKIEDGDEYFICSEKVKCVIR